MIIPGDLEEALTGVYIDPSDYLHPTWLPTGPNGNVVYMNFWATWCGYCVQEMPQLDEIYNMYKDMDYIHIHHDVGESKTTVVNWINSHDFEATFWTLDPTNAYWNLTRPWNGGSGGIPQHLVFDRDGRCRGQRVGGIGSVGIEPINKYLRELVPFD
jgi:thiol-disulfide isomerase/thioredoxin